MSDVRKPARSGKAKQAPQARAEERPEPTLWVGWILFGAMMMVLLGSFQAIAGLVALFNDGYYLVVRDQLLVDVGYDTWGWTHLVIGLVALVAGFGLMRGAMWARVTAVVVALLSAVVNLAFLAAFPVQALMIIALDVIVIYAVTAHGRELSAARMR